MPLIKWEPLFPELDKFFEDFPKTAEKGEMGKFVPSVDMYDEKGNLVVDVQLSNVNPEDVDIEIAEGHLLIKGKTEQKTEVSEKDYYRHEIHSGSFSRVVPLPADVDEDKGEATFEDGCLKVVFPKKKEAKKEKPKKIKLSKTKAKKEKK